MPLDQPPAPTPPVRALSKTRDIRFSVKIRAKPEQIYRALTSATELCRWWLQGAETDARSAGRFRMVWPKLTDGHRVFPRDSAVGECEGFFVDLEPGSKVAWMWRLPRKNRVIPPLINFFIQKKARGCEVELLHGGFSSEPAVERYLQGCAEGWEDCLAKLKLYLETGRTAKSQVLSFGRLKALAKRRK